MTCLSHGPASVTCPEVGAIPPLLTLFTCFHRTCFHYKITVYGRTVFTALNRRRIRNQRLEEESLQTWLKKVERLKVNVSQKQLDETEQILVLQPGQHKYSTATSVSVPKIEHKCKTDYFPSLITPFLIFFCPTSFHCSLRNISLIAGKYNGNSFSQNVIARSIDWAPNTFLIWESFKSLPLPGSVASAVFRISRYLKSSRGKKKKSMFPSLFLHHLLHFLPLTNAFLPSGSWIT